MEQVNYFAIIPANVRYDKDLKPNAKLLYGEITALSNKEGYCWASNEYFANLYGVSKETVSRWISQLAKKNYVFVEIEQAALNDKKRKIFIHPMTKKSKGIDEKIKGYCQKDQGGHDKKIKYNNTKNNTKNNTTTKGSVVVDESIFLSLSKEVKSIIGEKVGDKKLKELINNKGKDIIDKYLTNWDKFKYDIKKSAGAKFIDAVENEYDIPKQASNTNLQGYSANCEQREYTIEDFEQYYYKVTE